MNMFEYRRLSELGDRIKANIASQQEKDEYMNLLLKSESITSAQYDEYYNNQGTKKADDVLGAALAVGAIFLIGYLIKELASNKK